ncbi:MAG TPA: hypothetical protein VGP47_00070 [Parachlamydiaceae bacterium]|nr:hypothetical protein [Parachlamydiaceae bacterium]
MNPTSLTNLNDGRVCDYSSLPKSVKSQGETAWRPIVSIKAIAEEIKILHNQGLQRTAWNFLTLGIPLLFDSLSLFFSGLIHRETFGSPLKVRFKYERLPSDKVTQLVKFNYFNQVSSKPLNDAVANRCLNHMLRLINKLDEAKTKGDCYDISECQLKLNALKAILEKNSCLRGTRGIFNECDWKIADEIEFELTQEYFGELTDLFNTEWFSTCGLQERLSSDFGMNYHESVIAESLALALAYIEGLVGKTISLPIFDKALGKYQSVVFTIRSTNLGDTLPCYILECEDHGINPWMVIRGTQGFLGVTADKKEFRQGGLESVLNDSLDPDCVSKNVINKALVCRPIVKENGVFVQKDSLADIFRKWKMEGRNVNLAGHSLGGTLVNSLTVEFYDQINSAYAFSGAGVSYKTGKKWDKLNHLYPEMDLENKLINFDYDNDLIPSGGRRPIGKHLAITALLQIGPQGISDYHGRSHLNSDFQIQKVDVFKEMHKWTRICCERFRIITGKCFHILLYFFGNKYVPDWWKNRKVYHERAKLERKIRNELRV